MRVSAIAGLSVVLLLLAAALVADTFARDQQDATSQAEVEVPEPIPEEAKRIKNPTTPTAESIENGKMWFSSQCTMCHGKNGDGTGDLVERLQLPMPDFTDAAQQRQWTDGEMFYVLTHGHGRMPDQKDRFKDEIKWNLVNYIRTLAKSN